MPFTVITLKSVPISLRGDLSKWMQELSTGVYVGNFNSKVREQIWKRVIDSVKTGEAIMCYSCNNEIGYNFDTINTDRKVVDYDGIPLILISKTQENNETIGQISHGFSKAAKFRKAIKYKNKSVAKKEQRKTYVVIDIETDGLDYTKNSIIEIGAVKVDYTDGIIISEFQKLIAYNKAIPEEIKKLTGIDDNLLCEYGENINSVLTEFLEYLGQDDLVGYNIDFDLKFLNHLLKLNGIEEIKNNRHDIIKYIKKDKMFLENYKLQTVMQSYGINKKQKHRAIDDAKITFEISKKINKFLEKVK
ncbi:type I-E CRISPR-associated endoribonuclease Cas2 [Criibacterium bergeronii]|uniref:Type I-E CRISPR-associated endoribonuclease Cas2 n=1 Tax=Criibacterium bergeronii TaxID=1871336 RepID=A0A552VBY3_9FIRM|nr:type I-E CRISPR-associated endoribonuclease Cas2e [Criibacterium bergeronii]MBS6062677.1 type I-E CRISPR-associated endoribonuclease Cas2 [Peptostreptococcaceae bacterium]TRW27983.1 type I-E CRISPR-associated endoribonuclease Cas2 [Criibacterium bergeronii]